MSTSIPHSRPSSIPRAVVLVVALVAAVLLAVAPSSPAAAVDDVTPARVSGPERIATAAAIAEQAFPQGTPTAVVTTAVSPFDALTGASLAGALDAAMLLVYPDDVPEATLQTLDRLGVVEIVLVGGELSISPGVEATLAQNHDVSRLAGETQYDTAAIVSTRTAAEAGMPVLDGQRTMLLANGEVFADALAGSPAAFAGPTPVMFTETTVLRPEVLAFMDDVEVQQVVILGGTAAVSADVQAQIEDTGRTTVRLGGVDRVDTAAAVATWTVETLSFGTEDIMLARGDDFPDALTAAQLAGSAARPLLLSATPDVLPTVARAWFAERCDTIAVVQAVGGEAAVSTAVLQQAETAAETCTTEEGPGGDDALPGFTMTPLTLQAELSAVDSIDVTDIGTVSSFDAVLLPCDDVTLDGDGSAVFADLDADGFADGYATTRTGTSVITGINFINVESGPVQRGVAPTTDDQGAPRLSVEVSAYDADCAAVVVVPAQPAGAGIPVDAAGRATVAYGVSEVTFADGGTAAPVDTLVYRVEPTELGVAAGTTARIAVDGRLDDTPIDRPLDVVLFPCSSTQVTPEGAVAFADADGDGAADGFARTDTGAASVSAVNGQATEGQPTVVGTIQAVDDRIDVALAAGAADCTVVVVVAGNGNGQLDVDSDGVSLEDHGVARITWTD